MRVGLDAFRRHRVLAGLVLIVVLLALAEVWLVSAASSDPYGLSQAAPIRASDVNRVEALYGKSFTGETAVAWSADGRFVAVADVGIQVLDSFTGGITAQWKTPGFVDSLAWSPNGTWLAAGVATAGFDYDGWVIVYDVQGTVLASWRAVAQDPSGLAWSPRGDRILAAGTSEYGLWTSTGTAVYHYTNASTTGQTASWSPDGTRIVLGGVGTPLVINASTGAELTSETPGDWLDVAWSPRGDVIATGNANGTVALVKPDGTLVASRAGFRGGVLGMPVSWSPDAAMIATVAPDGIAIVSAADLSTLRVLVFPMGQYLAGLPPSPTYDIAAAWSPTGTAIAAVASTTTPSLRLWGIRHETLGLPLLAVGLTTAVGLVGVLWPDILGVAVSPDRIAAVWVRTDPRLRTGACLFGFAIVVSILESLGGDVLGRVYGLGGVPPVLWYEGTGLISAPIVAVSALVAAVTFHGIVWPSGKLRPFEGRSPQVYGYVLLPFLVALGLGNAVTGLLPLAAPSLGRDVAGPLSGAILGVVAGLGFYYSGRVVRGFPDSRSRVPWVALAASAVASIAVLFGIFFLLFIGLNVFRVPPPDPVFATYGITVLLDFGFVPFVAVVFGLVAAGTASTVPSALRFLAGGYARVRGDAILELQTRRRVLELVLAQPGIHFRGLLKESALGSGTLTYHLSVLEREGFLRHERQGRTKRFFATIPPGSAVAAELLKAV